MPPAPQLPELMRLQSGATVRSLEDWNYRRKELITLAQSWVYGQLPDAPKQVQCELLHEARIARLDGARKWSLRLSADDLPLCSLSLLLPARPGPFATLLHGDACWGYATDAVQSAVLARGFALAEFNRTEILSDPPDGKASPLLCPALREQSVPSIAAWAWGYHRAVDALLQLPALDGSRIAIVGHSRGGKAALLAGATDTRIALTGANNSGEAGAGCFRMRGPGAETLADLVQAFPHWLSPAVREFCGREAELPFDQHLLKALISPRALICTEALGDAWANPTGTQHSHDAAAEVYCWLGAGERLAIRFREGGHSHTLQDWTTLLDFMDATFSV